MPIQKLPNGRFRATVKHPATGKRVTVSQILGTGYGESSYRNKTDARAAVKAAEEQIKAALAGNGNGSDVTVRAFWERWLTAPQFTTRRNKPRNESTLVHNRGCTRGFVAKYGHLPITAITDDIALAWINDEHEGRHLADVKVLCAMFNDAAGKHAGRLITYNPFAGMGIGKGRGRRDTPPPSEEKVWELIGAARRMVMPSVALMLQVACFTGMRPGELFALKWDDLDFEGGWVRVDEQFNKNTRTFTPPKNGKARDVPMHAEAREALLAAREIGGDDFVFVNTRGDHWHQSSLHHHWKAVAAAVDWDGDWYLSTRHFAGWMMRDVMELDDEDVGYALGHTGKDVGKLVRETYGHRGEKRAMERVKVAYANRRRGDGLKAA